MTEIKTFTPATLAAVVSAARNAYDTRVKKNDAAKERAFNLMCAKEVEALCHRMVRRGFCTVSLRYIKRINGGTAVLFDSVEGLDEDKKARDALQASIDRGFYSFSYSDWCDFQKLATDAGLHFSYQWKFDKKSNTHVVNGFRVTFRQ